MEVYDLSVLTFLFVRNKNDDVICNKQFGPQSEELKDLDKKINEQKNLKNVMTKEQ